MRFKSVCTTRSLVKPIIRHLTNAVQMNKGCDHHQHMEDLMALELKEWNRRNVYLIEWLILLIVIRFVFIILKESGGLDSTLGFEEEHRRRFGWHSATYERAFGGSTQLNAVLECKRTQWWKHRPPTNLTWVRVQALWLLVLISVLLGFYPGSPVFPSPQLPTFQLTIRCKSASVYSWDGGGSTSRDTRISFLGTVNWPSVNNVMLGIDF